MAINVPTIVLIAILANICAGIMMVAVVDSDGNPVFDASHTRGYTIDGDEYYPDEFITELEKDIKPSGELEDAGDQIYRVLDTIGLGFIYKFILIIDKYLLGLVNMLDVVIGDMLTSTMHTILFGSSVKFGALKILLTISYILYGITLFTGKDVIKETSN